MKVESSDRHAHAGKHLHMGKQIRFVMFTGGTDAYGCTSKGQQGLMFIILKENNFFFQDTSRETSHTQSWTS